MRLYNLRRKKAEINNAKLVDIDDIIAEEMEKLEGKLKRIKEIRF